MAVEYKDYYKILGLSKTASEDDIRKAFRKLARKYHPDIAKDKAQAEEKFKEINEAYEVLSDSEKRKKYDQLGPNWEQFAQAGAAGGPGGFAGFPGGMGGGTWERTADGGYRRFYTTGSGEGVEFGGTGFSDFFEMFFGGGKWSDGGTFTQAGPGRAGVGSQPRVRPGYDIHADIMVSLEEAFHGSTRQITMRRRPTPDSKATQSESYHVKIPPGVHEGQLIRLAGQGEKGVGGGKAGDLFLRVRLESHPDFRVRGSDLFYTLPIAAWEAVLGTQVTIPTLEGHVSLHVPPGTASGKTLRLRGQGLPIRGKQRGDLHAEVRIETPTKITDEERNLWENLRDHSSFHPREK